jgi:hypothetical protein
MSPMGRDLPVSRQTNLQLTYQRPDELQVSRWRGDIGSTWPFAGISSTRPSSPVLGSC